MNNTIRKFLYFAAPAVVFVVALVFFSQASMADLRLKLGGLLESNEMFVKVGALYPLLPNGHVQPGPAVCDRLDTPTLNYYTTADERINIRNSLGYNIPVIANWSTYLLSPLGVQFPDLVGSRTVLEIEGHTLTIDPVAHTRFVSRRLGGRYQAELFSAKEGCADEVKRLYKEGVCVVLIHQTIAIDGKAVGYSYDDHCIVMDLGDDDATYEKAGRPYRAPKPRERMSETMSRAKDYLGFISYIADDPVPIPVNVAGSAQPAR